MRTEEFDFITGGASWKFCDINHNLVHGNATEKWAAGISNEHLRTVSRDRARIAVAVADANRGDPTRTTQESGAPVGNTVADRKIPDDGNSGLECHDRLKSGLKLRKRRATVEHQAGTHQIRSVRPIGEKTGRIGEMNVEPRIESGGPRNSDLEIESFDQTVEFVELLASEVGVFVGGREVGAEAGDSKSREGGEVVKGFGHPVRKKASAAHSSVDREVDGQRLIQSGGEGVELVGFLMR